MVSKASSQPELHHSSPTSLKILDSRNQYRSCHIRVPDQDKRLAAIQVGEKYYSFFKVVKDTQQAQEIYTRLARRGDETVVTKTVKGLAIWVWEPEFFLEKSDLELAAKDQKQTVSVNFAPVRVLESRGQYQPCHVRVPDLDKRLAAILVDGKYYGLLKVVRDEQQAFELAARLEKRGNETIIVRNARGYTVWVLEPDAQPDFSGTDE